VLQKRQKKNQLKRVNRKKMINILKTVCKSGRYSWRNWTLILQTLLKKKWLMHLEWNQRQNLVKIWNILHINFKKQILKGQLSINRGKSRSLAHNNFPVVLFFDFEIYSSAILRIHFCVPTFIWVPLFACLIFLGILSSCHNLTPFVWYCFFQLNCFLL